MPGASGHDVAIVGGGPAGLMASDVLVRGGARVTVYDQMPAVGRKLLLAGRGGLNLTHSEPLDEFLHRYGRAEPHIRPTIDAFSPDDLRALSAELGQPTFVGSSGRVFPKAMKASPLLRAWLRRLAAMGVTFTMKALIVVIMGGVGNLAGAMLAGIMLGLAETAVARLVDPGLTIAVTYALFLTVLLVRPTGLFGRPAR